MATLATSLQSALNERFPKHQFIPRDKVWPPVDGYIYVAKDGLGPRLAMRLNAYATLGELLDDLYLAYLTDSFARTAMESIGCF